MTLPTTQTKSRPKHPGPGLPADNRRCVYIKKSGERCRKPAMIGVNVCNTPSHGGSFPAVQAKAQTARANATLVKRGYGNATVDEDHVGASPVTGLAWELRRTAGKIIHVEEMLAELRDKDLIWGETSFEETETVGRLQANGRPGNEMSSTKREEARINLWVQLGLKERTHYKDLCKLAIAAGFEDRRIRMLEADVLRVNNVLSNVIARLGRDPDDPAIRSMVRDELLSLLPAEA